MSPTDPPTHPSIHIVAHKAAFKPMVSDIYYIYNIHRYMRYIFIYTGVYIYINNKLYINI